MQLDSLQTQLADIMHIVSQALLVPVIIVLLAFIGYALYQIGSIIAEAVTERRNFKVETPRFLKALMDASCAEVPDVIQKSGLLNRQKIALLTVYDYRCMPGDALIALVRRLVSEEEARYRRKVDRNNAAAKISPMVGLMGTLIPLGPGVAALGRGATTTLSSSLLIAFDTTVAGLIVAALCLAIGKIRSNWYDDYMSALDAAMATMLEKIEQLEDAGELGDSQPTQFAERFKASVRKRDAKHPKVAGGPSTPPLRGSAQDDNEGGRSGSAQDDKIDTPSTAESADGDSQRRGAIHRARAVNDDSPARDDDAELGRLARTGSALHGPADDGKEA